MSTKPVRLQLSRRKGFNLQAHSREVNGLEAVNCARPSYWGNPFKIGGHFMVGDPRGWAAGALKMSWCESFIGDDGGKFTLITTAAQAVEFYRRLMTLEPPLALPEIHGKNLACWCAPDAPCHADVLLEIANR